MSIREAVICPCALNSHPCAGGRLPSVPELSAIWSHLRALVVTWLQTRSEPGSPIAAQRSTRSGDEGGPSDACGSPGREVEFWGMSGEADFREACAPVNVQTYFALDDSFDSGADTEQEVGSDVTDMSDIE